MVYLEHSGTKFWRCELTTKKEVKICYGKCGSAGRTMTKKFESDDDASSYAEKQEASKRKGGYADAADPASSKASSGGKKRKAAPSASAKKVGLKNHAAPSLGDTEDDVKVDLGVAGVDAALASRAKIHDNFHAKLALVDPSKNHDKYYILQILIDENTKKPKGRKGRSNQGPRFYLFTRWGRTGTGGQAKLEGPDDNETAEESFAKLFKAKTGVAWSRAVPGAAPKSNKYEYLATAKKSDDDGHWFYYLQNDPLGKPDGWYGYDESNREETEELYGEYTASNNSARLSTRLVHSETSGFTYRVDLRAMTQTNTQSRTTRPIARTTSGNAPSSSQVGHAKPTPTPQLTTPGTAQPTPKKSVSAKSPTKKSAPTAARSLAAPMSVAAGAVDAAASGALQGGSIYCDFDVMLNQTNLGANNNKFYKIQLIETSSGVHLFTKWGRVGEAGATQEVGPMDSEKAIKEFEKKFRSKTGNKWEDRSDFQSKKGKYTMVEMEKDADAAEAMSSCASAASGSVSSRKVSPCTLDAKTKAFVDLIFNEDMFKSAMTQLNIDPNKLPLGALSKAQIERGFDALEKLEEEINGAANRNTLMELTSDFYTIIPHAFGRSRGPVLSTKESVAEKYDMLNTLTDIEAAQTMQKRSQNTPESDEAVKHPSDMNYEQLAADLTLVQEDDEDRPVVEKYLRNTKATGYHGGMKLRDVWRVDRHNESKRFAEHEDLSNRKLLWHGTNVAVVAAILKSGLRIMPHSGGRVGCGIYLADQHEKSAWYVSSARGAIIMFLVEAALGKQHEITQDDPSLVSAPKGFDSVLAKGTKAPNKDVELDIDGNAVMVPQGKPVNAKLSGGSSFAHNEFLIYKESQHRIRYVLRFDE